MQTLPVSGIQVLDEQEASGDAARVFDEIKREMEIPFVPNILKVPATSPRILEAVWEAYRRIVLQTSLPATLASMIGYAVSAANKCNYCNSLHKINCRALGVDDDPLAALGGDLLTLSPRRVQEIIGFAVKAGTDPINLVQADYDRVREQGISEEELMDIVALSAWATFTDRIADSLKIELDSVFVEALQS